MIINRPASSEDTARLRKIKRVMENRQEGIIVLENIADPHNAAAVWRTAEAFGFQKIYLVYSKEKAINPKKIGKASSASANKWLSFTTFRNTDECYKKLHKDGYKIYATVLDKEATNLQSSDFNLQKIAMVFGNEHRGLSEEAIKGADEKIYIPMKGMVQSLNISVTAAILMYEVDRQRSNPLTSHGLNPSVLRTSPLDKGDFKLSKREKEKLIKEFEFKKA